MLELYKNIKTLRLALGLTQEDLAAKMGYSDKSMISKIEAGKVDLPQTKILEFAGVLNTTAGDLMGWEEQVKDSPLDGLTNIILPAGYALPILGDICAGNGILCEENFQGTFYIDRSIKADFCLSIKGDSMKEANIFDGDMVFIRTNFDYSDGKIYAVRIEDACEAVIKKVYRDGEHVLLNPCNGEYSPIIKPAQDVSILGECVGTFHNIK